MYSLMDSQSTFLFKSFPTKRAVMLGAVKMTLHVKGKMAPLTKRFVAHCTCVRLFTSVNSHMYSQIMLKLKGFVANIAFVRCLV